MLRRDGTPPIRIDYRALARTFGDVARNITAMARALDRALLGTPTLIRVEDPAQRWPTTWRDYRQQIIDIFRHEHALNSGHPERSPGAVTARRGGLAQALTNLQAHIDAQAANDTAQGVRLGQAFLDAQADTRARR